MHSEQLSPAKEGSDASGLDVGGDGKGGPPDDKIKAGSLPTKDIELGAMGGGSGASQRSVLAP